MKVRMLTADDLTSDTELPLFLVKAFEGSLLAPGGFQSILPEFIRMVLDPGIGVFVCQGDTGVYLGVAVVTSYTDQFNPVPRVIHLYSRGCLKALKEAVVAFVKAHGHIRFLAVNGSGKDDKVWLKGMTPDGWSAATVGTIVEFKVK